jgi:hypothetical protein
MFAELDEVVFKYADYPHYNAIYRSKEEDSHAICVVSTKKPNCYHLITAETNNPNNGDDKYLGQFEETL